MLGGLFKFLIGGGTQAVENIATEWIETNQEKAEAQAVMIKAVDPNGKMRRDLSRFACQMYAFYLITTVFMIIMESFGIGDATGATSAKEALTELFTPITAAWGAIVGASFGVNGVNSYKGK